MASQNSKQNSNRFDWMPKLVVYCVTLHLFATGSLKVISHQLSNEFSLLFRYHARVLRKSGFKPINEALHFWLSVSTPPSSALTHSHSSFSFLFSRPLSFIRVHKVFVLKYTALNVVVDVVECSFLIVVMELINKQFSCATQIHWFQRIENHSTNTSHS